uniref:C2H2-type domain-containing protein n=1 Tax=Angiostrongylus cantonensis TaxID=6313 RepID=A0A158P8Q8_ANGCA
MPTPLISYSNYLPCSLCNNGSDGLGTLSSAFTSRSASFLCGYHSWFHGAIFQAGTDFPSLSSSSGTPAIRNAVRRCKKKCCFVCKDDLKNTKKRGQEPRRHILQHHLQRPLFQCPHCSYSSSYNKFSVIRHMQRKHHDESGQFINRVSEFRRELGEWYELCFGSGKTTSKLEVEQNTTENQNSENKENIAKYERKDNTQQFTSQQCSTPPQVITPEAPKHKTISENTVALTPIVETPLQTPLKKRRIGFMIEDLLKNIRQQEILRDSPQSVLKTCSIVKTITSVALFATLSNLCHVFMSSSNAIIEGPVQLSLCYAVVEQLSNERHQTCFRAGNCRSYLYCIQKTYRERGMPTFYIGLDSTLLLVDHCACRRFVSLKLASTTPRCRKLSHVGASTTFPKMQTSCRRSDRFEMELLPKVKLICGIFLSLTIVSTVLACALWDFQRQPLHSNLLYVGGLLLAFILNSIIAGLLLLGIAQQNFRMFFPYIVCSTIHGVISLLGIGFYVGPSIYTLIAQKQSRDDLYVLAIFSVLFLFWYWSFHTVRRYRDHVRKTAGEHHKLNDDDFT